MTISANLYKTALKNKYRFQAGGKAIVSVEDLFDFPLKNNNGVNLDTIALGLHSAIEAKSNKPISFVDVNVAQNDEITHLQNKLAIVLEIIEDKKAEQEAKRLSVQRNSEARRIREAIARKQDDQLKDATIEELQARLDALNANETE